MEEVQVISSNTIQAPTHEPQVDSNIELTPWDLQTFRVGSIQKGLLFHKPKSFNLENLKKSLSSTLNFFPPLSGRLSIIQHSDNTSSVFIVPNNLGVLFIHAIAPNITLSHILNSKYVPRVVYSFFPLNGVNNHQGTSHPLLAVQVTELIDGVFIGVSINHSAVDGTSFWHFVNTWAAISRASHTQKLSKTSFQRWFPENIHRPIRYPLPNQNDVVTHSLIPPPERVFHFSKGKIASLKAKAKAEENRGGDELQLSSLQVLLSHVWRCIIKHHRLQPEQEVTCRIPIGARQRISDPPLEENYVGNAYFGSTLRMKAGELVEEGGLGKTALEMKKMIDLHTEEKVKELYEDWVRNPMLIARGKNSVMIGGSPRFDVYGNDFGWGKPVAVRSGAANKFSGRSSVYRGEEEGSIDVEICIGYEILEAMANDHEFMDVVTI